MWSGGGGKAGWGGCQGFGARDEMPLTAAPTPAPRVPNNSLPYFHKRPRVSMLLLALLCLAVSVVWGVFRNEDQ